MRPEKGEPFCNKIKYKLQVWIDGALHDDAQFDHAILDEGNFQEGGNGYAIEEDLLLSPDLPVKC